MDKKTEDAFDSAGLLDDETKARFAAEKIATLAMIDRLEAKYADRGLKFTVPFSGGCPVQAFGHLDGLRFYFRFRSNWGQLKMGPYDREIEELRVMRINEDHAKRRAENEAKYAGQELSSGDRMWMDLGTREERVPREDAADYYPMRVTRVAGHEGHTPGDDYNGDLNNDEAYDMFSLLADSLEDVVGEEDQLGGGFTVTWYREGREAANAWQEKWNEDHKEEIEARVARYLEWKKESDARWAERKNSIAEANDEE